MYNIAIVDDNEAWGFALAIFLRQHNFSASAFNNPAVFLGQAHKFDLALVDFSIPSRRYQKEIDGPGLIKKLKQQLKHPPLFVLISAYFTEEILQYPGDICPDADAHLSKSTPLEDILHCIEQLLAKRGSSAKEFSTKEYSVREYSAREHRIPEERNSRGIFKT